MTNPDERARERQDGGYEPPVLAEPDEDRPVPVWADPDEDPPTN